MTMVLLGQYVLMILFVLFLMAGAPLSPHVAAFLSTTMGTVAVAFVALSLFATGNILLGILGLLVAYQLLKHAKMITGYSELDRYLPTEKQPWSRFTPIHQFPYTLEQEMVKKMANTRFNETFVKNSWRPALDNIHQATFLH